MGPARHRWSAALSQYRLVLLPLRTPKGPWRDTAKEAREDALEQGLASRDEHVFDRIYLDELAEIETREP